MNITKEMSDMAIEVFNRYEHKYLLSKSDFEQIIGIIGEHMTLDPYNIGRKPYTIANIYFDTSDDYLIRSSLASPPYKEKLRLRSYGFPDCGTRVFFEIKKKYRGIVNKRRSVMTLSEAYEFARTGRAPVVKEYMNGQVMREIEYFLSFYSPVPKLYLAYDRIAFFEKDNPDLRISFDTKIRSRRHDLRLEHGDYGDALLDEGTYLMEIKTARAKPLWLSDVLTRLNIQRCSFSKYGTEYRQFVTALPSVQKIAI